MRQIVAFGRVRNGKLALLDKPSYDACLARLKAGASVRVTIDVGEHRSSPQNRFWHGVVVPLFAEHCGEETKDMKTILALELLPVETKKFDGTIAITPGHTSDLTAQEFNDLIERAQRLGASMGIYVPDPNEYERRMSAACGAQA